MRISKASLLSVSKQLQQLIFGQISTTTEIQFNATYSEDIGHIHIDRPAGFLSKSEAQYIDAELLTALEKEMVHQKTSKILSIGSSIGID